MDRLTKIALPVMVPVILSVLLAGCGLGQRINPLPRGTNEPSIPAPLPPVGSVPISMNSTIPIPSQMPVPQANNLINGQANTLNAVDMNVAAVTRQGPISRYSLGSVYTANNRQYIPREDTSYNFSGSASWSGSALNGNRTASGETFNSNAPTAAHATLPFSTVVRVTNLNNNRSAVVRINDRGPFNGRDFIDLTEFTARELGLSGTQGNPVRVQILLPETQKVAQLTGSSVGTLGSAVGSSEFASVPRVQAEPLSPVNIPAIDVAPVGAVPRPISSNAQPISVGSSTQMPNERPLRPRPPASPSTGGSLSDLPPLPTVGSQPTQAVNTASAPSAGGAGFFVQAGQFSAPDNAEQLRGKLAAVGNAAVRQQSGAFRVLVGPYGSQQEAQAALGRVIGAGAFDATIIQQ